MTHRQLMQNLDLHELAYWRGHFALKNERYEEARIKAEQEAESKARIRSGLTRLPIKGFSTLGGRTDG